MREPARLFGHGRRWPRLRTAAETSPSDRGASGRFGQFQDLINSIRQHKAYTLIGYVVRRFSRDSCASVASSLSYTSLLAMVPMMAIGLAMFAAFPAFGGMRDTLLRSTDREHGAEPGGDGRGASADLHPQCRRDDRRRHPRPRGHRAPADQHHPDRVRSHLGRRARASRSSASRSIGRCSRWGRSCSASPSRSPAMPSHWRSRRPTCRARCGSTPWIAPFLLEAVGFLLFYRLMPTRPVRWMDAAAGAIIAAVLFEAAEARLRLSISASSAPTRRSMARWRRCRSS